MHDAPLNGARILIVEDEAIIALELQSIMTDAGAVVVGPARTMAGARTLARNEELSAALLDVQIGDDAIFPVAELLAKRGIPFAFNTGFGDGKTLAIDWPDTEVLTKPARETAVVQALARLVHQHRKIAKRA